MYRYQGLTFVELMVTIALAGIMITLTIPSFRDIIQNNRSVTLSQMVARHIHLTKSEAIKRGQSVSICPAANSNYTNCGNNWSNGWIIFVDPDANGVIDSPDDRVAIQEAMNNGNTITTTVNRITFSGNGFVTAGSGSINSAANGCTGQNGRVLNISNTGRISIQVAPCN